jgi:CDP-diacylglycerol--serine O-phosphatidyltransferase
VAAALFIALLLTYPSLTLAMGSVTYLALIPVSAYRYLSAKRKSEIHAKAQNGAGAAESVPKPEEPETTRLSAK